MKDLKFFKDDVNEIPVSKFFLGILGIAGVAAAIKGFGINDYTIPVITILTIIGVMVLLVIFSSISKSKDRKLKLAGYIMTYTTLTIACLSAMLLFSSAFFNFPLKLAADTKLKTITLTGAITINGEVPEEGYIGILQNSEIMDKLSNSGTFNLSFNSPEFLSNGLVTLTFTFQKDLFELMEINLNDLKDKNNIMDLGIICLPELHEISEDDSLGFNVNSIVNNIDTVSYLNIKRIKNESNISQQTSDQNELIPFKSDEAGISNDNYMTNNQNKNTITNKNHSAKRNDKDNERLDDKNNERLDDKNNERLDDNDNEKDRIESKGKDKIESKGKNKIDSKGKDRIDNRDRNKIKGQNDKHIEKGNKDNNKNRDGQIKSNYKGRTNLRIRTGIQRSAIAATK